MFDADRSIHSKSAKLLRDGIMQTHVTGVEATVENDKQELNVLGDEWTRHKSGQLKGTGNMSGYKVTSDMIVQGFRKFELLLTLEDPEAYGFERVRLKNCMADSIQLMNVEAGSIIEEETPFTFEGYELLDEIVAGF